MTRIDKPWPRSASPWTRSGAVGVAVEQVVRTRMYVVDIGHQDRVGAAHRELFGEVRPVATMVQVGGLADPEHLVEVEVEAYQDDRAS